MTDQYRRFVILKHVRGYDVHWDFMIESDGSLQTWRIDISPDILSQETGHAEKISDHPLRFLTYEGPVNKGKATVTIAETGKYRIIEKDGKNITLKMDGNILRGKFSLKHIDKENWQIEPVAP